MELAATARAFALIEFAAQPLRNAIAAQAIARLTEFDAKALTNTAWAFAKLVGADSSLLNALSAAAIPKISADNLQMVATLLDLNLSCHDHLEVCFHDVLPHLAAGLPQTASAADVAAYEDLLRAHKLHSFGAVGARSLLAALRITSAPAAFCARAASAEVSRDPAGGELQRRVFGYMEYRLADHSLEGTVSAWSGASEGAVSAWGGAGEVSLFTDAFDVSPWLRPSRMAFPASAVDRSQCAEFKLLASLVRRLRSAGLLRADGSAGARALEGAVWIFCTAAPCPSCVAAVVQLQRLLPAARVAVSFPHEDVTAGSLQPLPEADA